MKIVDYKLVDIHPAKYNPRKITSNELQGLTESIKKFGFVDPLIVNIKDGKNTLIGGHQRLKVAEILKHKTVPVVEVDLSLSEEKALNIALNSPTISGKFDGEILNELLKEVEEDSVDIFDNLFFEDLLDVQNEIVDEAAKTPDEINTEYKLVVIFPSEKEMIGVHNSMVSSGYKSVVRK